MFNVFLFTNKLSRILLKFLFHTISGMRAMQTVYCTSCSYYVINIYCIYVLIKAQPVIHEYIVLVTLNRKSWRSLAKQVDPGAFFQFIRHKGDLYLQHTLHARQHHRYLMSRLSFQVFYLWRHVLLTAPPFISWWSNLEILFATLHRSSPFTGGLRCQAIQT
jgi:hypothetical protein